jgi:hypothetical protein
LNRGRAVTCRVECRAYKKKNFSKGGGVRLFEKGHKVGPQAYTLGHPRKWALVAKAHLGKARLAKAKGRVKRRAEASSKAKAETKAKLKLKVKLKLNSSLFRFISR